jgi:hypothetical protein
LVFIRGFTGILAAGVFSRDTIFDIHLSNRVSILAGVSATLIYGAALLALAIWASGGLRQFKDKYVLFSSE